MKMTDESALLAEALAKVNYVFGSLANNRVVSGSFGVDDETCCRWMNALNVAGARLDDIASLAACQETKPNIQQKGDKDENVIYQWMLGGNRWKDMSLDWYEQVHDKGELVVGYDTVIVPNMTRKLYTTPQPSIPAPAQQDGKASGGEVVLIGYVSEQQLARALHFGDVPVLSRGLAAIPVFAHPPHADQETQG